MRGPADPFLAFLCRLPLIGSIAPRPRTPNWDTPMTYRVQLHAVSGRLCGACVEAVLLDAA